MWKWLTSRLRRLRRLRDESGQAAFEFLLVLPLFILFILMTVDFGMLMYEYVSVNNAAREGARYGAVNCHNATTGCTVAEIKNWARDRSGGILTDADVYNIGWLDNSVPSDGVNYGRGDSVVVTRSGTPSPGGS